MTVKELIDALRNYDQDAMVVISESSTTWDNVLVIVDEEANPDDCSEIHLGG
jgi:hypothetical protein